MELVHAIEKTKPKGDLFAPKHWKCVDFVQARLAIVYKDTSEHAGSTWTLQTSNNHA